MAELDGFLLSGEEQADGRFAGWLAFDFHHHRSGRDGFGAGVFHSHAQHQLAVGADQRAREFEAGE